MSETLQAPPIRRSDELPYAIDLELHVEDRDVIAALVEFPEGLERDEYALEALKIGVLALRRASSALDGEFVQREMTRMLESLQERLDRHADGAKERLEASLKSYFHPESGHFSQRVADLTSDNGGLARLLKEQLDGDNSRLAKTMIAHVGDHSPLMKFLDPQQSDGFLCLLKASVEKQLREQQSHILKEFSLDDPGSALSQMIERLTAKHGSLSKDIQGKIDEVIKEFSLNEEDSALNRLVNRINKTQETISNEFSLKNDQSALACIKKELMTLLSAHFDVNKKFQEEVKVALGKLVTRRETEARTTQHGATFEDALYHFVNHDAQRRGDVAEFTKATTGVIKHCKVGDVVVQLGCDCAAAGARIVFEAKAVAGYSLRKAREEIELARKNREAQQGVFVFSRNSAPDMPPLSRHGADVFVTWDAEDEQTNAYLLAAIEISRALCVRAAAARAQSVDFAPIDSSILLIEKHINNLDTVSKSAQTIKNASEKILERVEKDRKELSDQLEVLRTSINVVKHALRESGMGPPNSGE